jgi:hypothetical protein
MGAANKQPVRYIKIATHYGRLMDFDRTTVFVFDRTTVLIERQQRNKQIGSSPHGERNYLRQPSNINCACTGRFIMRSLNFLNLAP